MIDPRLRLGSGSEASVGRPVEKANGVPRPAKPARQNVARRRRRSICWRRAADALSPVMRPRSGKSAAPASPAAARRPPCPPGGILTVLPDPRRSIGSILSPVERDHGRAAEAEVVLEAHLGSGDLPLVGLAAELPVELRALGEAGCAEWVPLGDEATRRVHDPLAAIGDGARVDQLAALAGLTQAEPLVGDQLVGREAIVQLDDVDVLRANARLLVDLLGGLARHV